MLKPIARRLLRVALDCLWAAEMVDGASYIRSRFRIDVQRIVEAGCRFGEDSLLLAASFPRAKLMAFECNAETLKTTRVNVALSRSIQLVEVALDAQEGEVDFFAASQSGNPGASSLLAVLPGKEQKAWLTAEEVTKTRVHARRLDDILMEAGWRDVDILWMDVEGAEDRVLRGAPKVLSHVGMVYTEVSIGAVRSGQASFEAIRDTLEHYGLYEVRPWIRRTKRLLGAGTANVIFVRDGHSTPRG